MNRIIKYSIETKYLSLIIIVDTLIIAFNLIQLKLQNFAANCTNTSIMVNYRYWI